MAIQYICNNPQRKTRVRETVGSTGGINNGIDYLEVYDPLVDSTDSEYSHKQKRLFVHFINSDSLTSVLAEQVRVEGGSRVKDIEVTKVSVDPEDASVLIVELDRYGDFSLYTFRIVKGAGDLSPPAWLDPILSSVEFSFKVACPSDFDCQQQVTCPPTVPLEPEIDYLAKDYASFRQLMLDRLANIIPDWSERNPSDVGMAIVDILAYAGDHLSYYQDAIATEAYLGTARRRVSMRRHARLLDYPMHDGCNARTWVVLSISQDTIPPYVVPAHTPLLTAGPTPEVTELDLTPESGYEPILNVGYEDFALLATESLHLMESIHVDRGHVGANEPFSGTGSGGMGGGTSGFSVLADSKVHIGDADSIVFGDKIFIASGAQVTNVAYNTELNNHGSISGETYHPVSFPLLSSLPVVPDFTPGSTNVEVDDNESITLAAGDYAALKVCRHGCVTFSGGIYNFRSVQIESHARLVFAAQTEIRIDETIDTEGYVHINEEDLGETANRVIIYVRGHESHEHHGHHDHEMIVKFGYQNRIHASVYAPTLPMVLRARTQVTGTLFAQMIVAGSNGQYQAANVQAPPAALPLRDIRFCIETLSEGMHVFETLHPVTLHQSNNSIEFYTWGDDDCCLPKGATRASLDNAGDQLAHLQPGDLLLFEEILGLNGRPEDVDITHRHVVRLTRVDRQEDSLYEPPVSVLDIEWSLADALPFPLCLKKVIPDIPALGGMGTTQGPAVAVSVARGNVVLVDHGRTICQEAPEPAVVPASGETYRPRLRRRDLTYLVPYKDEEARLEPATGILRQDSRQAVPDLNLKASNNETWTPRRDLLNSGRFAAEFVTEMEDDGQAYLRFGDSVLGKQPAAGLSFMATYRVGSGVAGNIGAETIKQIILTSQDQELLQDISVRNPLPAQGGTDPEAIEQVRLYAPQAFRTQKRAVTPSDYAQMAEQHPQVQKAVAIQRWTGSWHTVFLTIDRTGGREVDAAFEQEIRAYLEPLRMMGHDIEVEAPRLVALDIIFRVCVRPEYLKSKVKEELLEVFSDSELPDGRLGFFHPDNFTFGQSVYLSRLVAAAMQVPGVTWVDPVRFQRWGESRPRSGELPLTMALTMGRLEIAELNNDPNAPENGKIDFVMEGGL